MQQTAESNLTFSGGQVVKRLQYSNLRGAESPTFKAGEVTDFAQPNLQRYQNILEKIQMDHGLYEERLDDRLKQLESDTERNNNSIYLNQAYQKYLSKSESQRKMQDAGDTDSEYQNYLKRGKQQLVNESLQIDDIISHPETLHFLNTYFASNCNTTFDLDTKDITILKFVDRLVQVCNLDLVKEDQQLFETLMKDRLTTYNAYLLSLNALEVATKEKGLFRLVEEIVQYVIIERQKKKQSGLNSKIVNELEAVTDMLEQRKLALKREEQRLQEWEADITRQVIRNGMTDAILRQYELQMRVFDESMQAKQAALNKRYHVIEHTLKQKLKLIESKGQTALRKQQVSTSDTEKLKAKIFSLEKQVLLYKGKNEDLEKKLQAQAELTRAAQAKADRLGARCTTLERTLKEQKSQSQLGEEVEQTPEPLPPPPPTTKPKVKVAKCDDEPLRAAIATIEGLMHSMTSFKPTVAAPQLIGELTYPYLSDVLPPLVELTPAVLPKMPDVVIQLLLYVSRFIYFKRFGKCVSTLVPVEELDVLRQRNKSSQYQVNEIMQQGQSRGFEVLLPNSKFLKGAVKNASSKENPPRRGSYLQLTQSDEVQRTLIQGYRQYIQSSESQIKRQITNDLQHFEVGVGKQNPLGEARVLVTRCNACCLIAMLAYEVKDCIFSVKNLTYDLRNENEHLTRYLKTYITDLELIFIVVTRMQVDLKDLTLVIPTVELMLEMCAQGPHYDAFLMQNLTNSLVRQLRPFMSTLIQVFSLHVKDNDLCEKLSIVIWRVLSGAEDGAFASLDVQKLTTKLSDIQGGSQPLLESNLKSILEMINS